MSKPWIESIHTDDREATVLIGKRLAAGEPVYFFENRYQCKDGSYRWISWNALPLPDEEAIVDVGKGILENLGYDVLGETDPSEALETFRLQPDRFDLVITDLTMPHMTGLQLAEQLTLMKPDIPIILCTGLGDKNTKKEAKTKGIKKFVYKPISVYKLAETVREVLNERL